MALIGHPWNNPLEAPLLPTPQTAATASVAAVQIKHRNIYSKMKRTMREIPSNSCCRNCGGTHPAERDQCPAFGQQCHNCGKQNHFKSQCRSTKSSRPNRQINQLYAETNSSSESEDTFTIEGLSLHDDEQKIDKEGHCFVTVNDKQLNLKVDTGAKCNVMSNTYKLVRHNEELQMPINPVNLVAFGGSMITPIGTVTLPCRTAYI